MPRTSEIGQVRELSLLLTMEALVEDDDEECEEAMTLLACMENRRTAGNNVPVPKSLAWYQNVLLNPSYNENRFRTQLRMSKESFINFVNMMAGMKGFY